MNDHYLFVYGTLKENKHNHSLLESYDASFHGKYKTNYNYGLVIDSIPYMIKRKDACGVFGELYKISDECLKSVDELEGHPNWYKRVKIQIFNLKDGTSVDAYTYIYPDVFEKNIKLTNKY